MRFSAGLSSDAVRRTAALAPVRRSAVFAAGRSGRANSIASPTAPTRRHTADRDRQLREQAADAAAARLLPPPQRNDRADIRRLLAPLEVKPGPDQPAASRAETEAEPSGLLSRRRPARAVIKKDDHRPQQPARPHDQAARRSNTADAVKGSVAAVRRRSARLACNRKRRAARRRPWRSGSRRPAPPTPAIRILAARCLGRGHARCGGLAGRCASASAAAIWLIPGELLHHRRAIDGVGLVLVPTRSGC